MLVAKWLFFDQCFLATVTIPVRAYEMVQSNLFTTATLGTEESSHCGGEKAVMGR